MGVDLGEGELFMQGDETEEMIFDAAAGVLGAGAGAQNERPVAGLGQEQFPTGLFQGPLLEVGRRFALAIFFGQLGHALLRDLQMGINPFVGFIQPNAPVAFLAPA